VTKVALEGIEYKKIDQLFATKMIHWPQTRKLVSPNVKNGEAKAWGQFYESPFWPKKLGQILIVQLWTT
jgi:hypothetical protein